MPKQKKSEPQEITKYITRELVQPGIYKYISTTPQIGWTVDRRSGKWTCYGIDIMISASGAAARGDNGKKKRRRHREKPISSRESAEKVLARIKLAQTEKKYEINLGGRAESRDVTLKDAFEKIVPTIEDVSERRRAERITNVALEFFPPYYNVEELTFADTFGLAEHRRNSDVGIIIHNKNSGISGQHIKPSTVRREMTTFSSVLKKIPLYFKELKDWKPPQVYRPKVPKTGREVILVKDDRKRLIEYLLSPQRGSEAERYFFARRRTGLLIYFLLMTSLRHGDGCKVLKSWHDQNADRLKVRHGKTETFTIYQPVPDTIKWILKEARELNPNSEYFFSRAGKIHGKTYKILRDACTALGINYGSAVADGFIPHVLRHTVTTTLQQNRIDTKTAQGITGHRNLQTVTHYTHASDESRRAAIIVMERELSIDGIGGKAADAAGGVTAAAAAAAEASDWKDVRRLYFAIKNGEIDEAKFKQILDKYYSGATNEENGNS